MSQVPGDPLSEVLIEAGVLTREQVESVFAARSNGVERVEEVIARLGLAREEEIYTAVAERLGLEFVPKIERDIAPGLLTLVPSEFAMRHQVLPLREEDHTLVIAVANPFDVTVLDDLRLLTNRDVRPVVAVPRQISEGIENSYMEKMFRDIDDLQTEDVADEDLEIADLQKMAREALVIKLVNLILHQAIQERASDVHIEPLEKQLRVRYRIDGVLHEASSPPRHLHAAIVSRIKIMSDMDIAERRLPQDGRVRIRLGSRMIDLRVSSLPTLHGESVVIRLLDRTGGLMRLTDLGMQQDNFAQFRRLITRPHGIILVTGPTGSGKTTTLYAALHEVYTPEKKIITIEEPVEYELAGANQIAVRPEIGLTFATGLRHIVRQDPDIIMVGEIRDRETADISIHAALTGHLVFSTVHTNDAATAITRLIDLGLEPYLINATLEGIVAQRLVRRICPNCREEYEPTPEAVLSLGLRPEEVKGKKFYRGRGCDRCNNIGYYGRMGIFEILVMNDELREMMLQDASTQELRTASRKFGCRALRESGLLAIYDGLTTIEEVARVTLAE